MIFLQDLVEATGARLRGHPHRTAFPDFCFDSRLAEPGELFVAVRTARGDGHDFVEAAIESGVRGVLAERTPPSMEGDLTWLVVPDTRRALQAWAAHVLARYGTEVVGITGSVGKTTAKEAIAAVLSGHRRVFKNFANYNGLFGLPIALGRLEPEHEVAVLELASDSRGEVASLAELTRPRIGVVTAVGWAHTEYLGDLDGVAREKQALVEALPPDGLAILNWDDPRVAGMAHRAACRVVKIGASPGTHLRLVSAAPRPRGLEIEVAAGHDRLRLRLALLGRHSAYAALASLAVAQEFGVPLSEAIERLEALHPLEGRLRPLHGRSGATVVDDTYSATPASALAALEVFGQWPGGPKVAVLGEMLQLGGHTEEAHRELGLRVAGMADVLITQGDLGRLVAHEALRAGMSPAQVHITFAPDDAVRAVEPHLAPGAVVLVKGSMENRMERIVAGLLAQPEEAPRLLVRQTRAWRELQIIRADRPTWMEIDLGAVGENLRLLRGLLQSGARLMAVLKADAYGHGAVKVARTAVTHGADWLGVAALREAVDLRAALVGLPVLVLGYTPPWQAREAVVHEVSVAVFSLEVARAFSEAARAVGKPARVQVKVDTGMGRLGLFPAEVPAFLAELARLPGLTVEGIFTHLSVADEAAPESVEHTRGQIRAFASLLDELAQADLRPPLAHAANTAALIRYPEGHFDMVRAGLGLYGLQPSPDVPLPGGARPALALKTQVAQVKTFPPGAPVGYGRAFVTERETILAVLPIGYADGFRRAPRTWPYVLIRGRRAPVVGQVSMDQATVDVTGIPGVRPGDEVVLIGRQGEESLSAETVAEALGTINYEVVAAILARVPRVP